MKFCKGPVRIIEVDFPSFPYGTALALHKTSLKIKRQRIGIVLAKH